MPTTALAKVPQPHGGALNAGGTPGNGGGRPKDEFRRHVRAAFAGKDGEEHGVTFLAKVMRGDETEDVMVTRGVGKDATVTVEQVRPKLRDRLTAAEMLMDRGYGKPDQTLQIDDDRPQRTGEQVMAHILELLPKVIPMLPVDRKEIARLLAERRQIEVLVQGKEIVP